MGKTGTNHNPAMRTHIPCAPRTPITPVKSVEKKIIYEPKKTTEMVRDMIFST